MIFSTLVTNQSKYFLVMYLKQNFVIVSLVFHLHFIPFLWHPFSGFLDFSHSSFFLGFWIFPIALHKNVHKNVTEFIINFSGEQRLLGLLRFELHSALAEKARRCENAERRHELLWRSLEAAELCTRSLAKEPSCLHEGLMAGQAEKNAIDLRKMIC